MLPAGSTVMRITIRGPDSIGEVRILPCIDFSPQSNGLK